ncbi:hypothetical protein NL676_013524 [Syzygium grande]|nr:hypothetical protein NL676_013524 [Syzygium grande]
MTKKRVSKWKDDDKMAQFQRRVGELRIVLLQLLDCLDNFAAIPPLPPESHLINRTKPTDVNSSSKVVTSASSSRKPNASLRERYEEGDPEVGTLEQPKRQV